MIVNADDFNLTNGVSKGILEAHDSGIVTSTSALINLPIPKSILAEVLKRKSLGVGLHLNITLGSPLTAKATIHSLLNPDGFFKKRHDLNFKKISAAELHLEYQAQIERFKEIFRRLPTHLDTHHHLHEGQKVFDVLARLAIHYHIPLRRSSRCGSRIRKIFSSKRIRLADYLWEDLDSRKAWTQKSLAETILSMKSGFHELMCHPGRCDGVLMKKSSFNRLRERELKALCSQKIKRTVKSKEICLINFAELQQKMLKLN